MKLHTEDPRLTAYLLGELGPEEAAAVEQAIAAVNAAFNKIDRTRTVPRAPAPPTEPPKAKRGYRDMSAAKARWRAILEKNPAATNRECGVYSQKDSPILAHLRRSMGIAPLPGGVRKRAK